MLQKESYDIMALLADAPSQGMAQMILSESREWGDDGTLNDFDSSSPRAQDSMHDRDQPNFAALSVKDLGSEDCDAIRWIPTSPSQTPISKPHLDINIGTNQASGTQMEA
jgi:hypothetical protein